MPSDVSECDVCANRERYGKQHKPYIQDDLDGCGKRKEEKQVTDQV